MSAIAFLRSLLDDGMPLDMAMKAAEKFEASSGAAMTARQARNRRYYEAKKVEGERLKASENRLKTSESEASEKRLKASESVLIQTPLAHVRDNPSRLVISGQTVVDVSANALDQPDDWPTGNLVDILVAEVASPRLDPSKAPGLVQTSGRLAAWRRDGASWEFDVLPVVKVACAKSRTPIGSWKYFDPAIAQSIADNRRALEIPEATPLRAGGPVVSFADKIGADNAEARRRAFELLDAREARNG